MTKVLVTGANGQLGMCIQDASKAFPNLDFTFASKGVLDIANDASVTDYFRKNDFQYCINTAAYTLVDKAETGQEEAFKINAEAPKNIATACKKNNCTLVHISTDYVFDGKKRTPYTEEDATNPINVYGASKLKGEENIAANCDRYFIFRTSWLYSQYGNNFLKTILRFSEEGKPLTITTEQTGTPTNANDLAEAILNLISEGNSAYGLYHYSNDGEATWYDFAEAILTFSGKLEVTNLAKTEHYPTFARRPEHSVLDLQRIKKKFNIPVILWQESLNNLINTKINIKS